MSIFNFIIGILTGFAALVGIMAYLDINIDDLFLKLNGRIPEGFLIFITGTNGVGKTTTANKVYKKLGMRYINVNSLREALRSQKELYKKAGDEALYNILKESTYLLDNPDISQEIVESDFQKQCEILGTAIAGVATYNIGQNLSTVFEGINISPKTLMENDIPLRYVLFVNLRVTDKNVLKRRLDKKARNNAEKGNLYRLHIDKIIQTATTIDNDFASINDNDPAINKLIIDNTALSVRKVTNKIIKEVRIICNPKK